MTACVEHNGCLNKDGYGVVNVVTSAGRVNLAHRLSFYKKHGYLPEVVRHKCDNPSCVNPDHLEAGTQQDNVRDAHLRNRAHRQGKVLTDAEVLEIKKALKTPHYGIGKELAAKYGVSKQLITNIKYGRNRLCAT